MSKYVKQITFSCVYLNGAENRFKNANDLYKKFTRIAEELKIPYNPKLEKTKLYGDFYQISENLFTQKTNAKYNGQVEIFEAETKKQEIDAVANKILKAVEGGRKFNEIGVLFASSSDLKQIKDCFDVYEIPYFANVAESVESNVMVSFIETIFEVFLTGFSSGSVLKLLSNSLFKTKNFAFFQNYVIVSGSERNDFFSDYPQKYAEKFREYYENLSEISGEQINQVDEFLQDIEKLNSFYRKFSPLFKNAKCAGDFVEILRTVLEQFSVKEELEKMSKTLDKNGFLVQREIFSQIYKKYVKLLDEIEFFLSDARMSVSEFLSILKAGLTEIKINIAPLSIDAVIIQGDTDGFYGLKEMFIVGANEGNFPHSIYDSGILDTAELEEATEILQSNIEPLVRDINSKQEFNAYLSLFEPSEKLHISYSIKSSSGAPQKSARLVQKIIKLFGEDVVLSKDYQKADTISKEILERRFAGLVSDFYLGKVNLSVVNDYYFSNFDRFSENFNEMVKNIKVYSNNFDLEVLKDMVFSNGKTSVSQFQTYFDCPYKFFIQYALRLREIKPAKLGAMDIGTIIHRFVEKFTKNLDEFNKLKDEKLEEKLKELVSNILDEFNVNEKKNKALAQIIENECLELGKSIIVEQQNSSFKIFQQEYEFRGVNSVNLALKDGVNLSLEGKIDRIDTYGNYVRVVDYKTGKDVSASLDTIYVGKKIQLPSYFEAIEKRGYKLAGVFYLPIHNSYQSENSSRYKMSGFLLDDVSVAMHMDERLGVTTNSSDVVPVRITNPDKKTGEVNFYKTLTRYSEKELMDIKNYVHLLMVQAAEEILSGYIMPSPIRLKDDNEEVPHACKYCKIRGFCGLEYSKFPKGRIFGEEIKTENFDLENKD